MARPADLRMDINEAARGHIIGTVTITGMRRFNLRVWLAVALVRLGCWVAPVGIDVEDERKD